MFYQYLNYAGWVDHDRGYTGYGYQNYGIASTAEPRVQSNKKRDDLPAKVKKLIISNKLARSSKDETGSTRKHMDTRHMQSDDEWDGSDNEYVHY